MAGRLKSMGKYLTLSANMAGVFKLSVETELVQCETVYRHLENPQLGKRNVQRQSVCNAYRTHPFYLFIYLLT